MAIVLLYETVSATCRAMTYRFGLIDQDVTEELRINPVTYTTVQLVSYSGRGAINRLFAQRLDHRNGSLRHTEGFGSCPLYFPQIGLVVGAGRRVGGRSSARRWWLSARWRSASR